MKDAYKDWIIQIKKIYAGENAICPECGCTDTKHRFYVFDDGVGYGDLTCPACGSTAHLCRLRYPEGIKVEVERV